MRTKKLLVLFLLSAFVTAVPAENSGSTADDKSCTDVVLPKVQQKPNAPVVYVDLGLPSGTLWQQKATEHSITYRDALKKYVKNLPSQEQWEELKKYCEWEKIDNGEYYEQDGEVYRIGGEVGFKVRGLNGNSIYIQCEGYVDTRENLCVGCGGVGGSQGVYFSSTCRNNYSSVWCFWISDDGFEGSYWNFDNVDNYQLSVILVQ